MCARKSFVSDPLKMAVSPDGKFVFLIGGRKINVVSEGQHPEWTTSFEMNIIDVDAESRKSFWIEDLCDFGEYFVHLYAMNNKTVVILDYNFLHQTLRQRLIQITTDSAFSPFHRCYRYSTSQTSYIKAAIGHSQCAVISRSRFDGEFVAMMFPKDPTMMSFERPMTENIGHQITQMNNELRLTLDLSVTHYISPFFMRNDQDLCFLTVNRHTLDIDPKVISCFNIGSKIWYTREMSRSSNSSFPQDEYEQTPLIVDCVVSNSAAQQVALVARYRTPIENWRWRICDVVLWLQMRLVRLFFLCLEHRAEFFGNIVLSVTAAISNWRDYLVLRPFTRVGVLNLKSLLWTDLSPQLNDVRYTDQITQFATDTGQMVSAVFQPWSSENCEFSIRLHRPPFAMSSLYSIANFKLQKSPMKSLHDIRRRYISHLSSSHTRN